MRLPAPIGLLAAAALALSACGQAASTKGGPGGDQIRDYLLAHPEVIEQAIAKLNEKRQAAADAQITAALAANRDKLERDPRDYVAGNPLGKVTLVEFFDYRCPYCKSALPELQKLVAANKDVRFVLKEYPILSAVSESASRAALAAKAQGKYWPVHEALLAEKNLDEAAIQRILKENGVDLARAEAAANDKAVTQQIADVHELAHATNVTGTPAFMVGDKMVAGWSAQEIQAAIEAVRKAG